MHIKICISLILLILTTNCKADEIVIYTIIGESANQSYDGMLAVSNVIRNRAKSRRMSHEDVCLQPKQFSCWNDLNWLKSHLKANSRHIQLARKAWIDSEHKSIVGKADHYYADYIKKPYWAKSMKFVKKIGRHLFYESR